MIKKIFLDKKILLLGFNLLLFVSCTDYKSSLEKEGTVVIDSVNEKGRLLPKKLREIPFGIIAGHQPNPCYAEKEDGMYVWKHNTTVVVNEDLDIIEYGSFVYTQSGWYHRVAYNAKDFDEHYGTTNGKLLKGIIYTDPNSWRKSDSLWAGDAMWYYIAKNKNGELIKGIAPIETEGKLLNSNVTNKNSKSRFSSNSILNWTGYGEIGNYALSGTLKLKDSEYTLQNDTLKDIKIIFDMNSIASDNSQLIEHLKAEDFFDVKKYPTSLLEMKEILSLRNKSAELTGKLTIKDKSKDIKVFVTIENDKKIITGKISIDRTNWGIIYNSKSFFSNLGDQAIKNKIDIKFKIEL